MKRIRHRGFLTACLAGLLLCISAAGTAQATQRIADRPSAVVMLAESLIDADPAQRWAFADTLLDVMVESFGAELRDAADDRATTRKRQAKLQRWQRATRDMLVQLTAARLRLTEGADAVIHVDRQQQVLLFVDRQPIVLSAPRPGTERQLGDRIVDRYCAFNDCSILQGLADPQPAGGTRGSWTMGDRQSPAYLVDDRVRCSFADLSRRADKQRACEQLARETTLLLDGLRSAQRRNAEIDWPTLAHSRTLRGGELLLRVTAGGDYLRLGALQLGRLSDRDWAATLQWLRRHAENPDTVLWVLDGERLVDSAPR